MPGSCARLRGARRHEKQDFENATRNSRRRKPSPSQSQTHYMYGFHISNNPVWVYARLGFLSRVNQQLQSSVGPYPISIFLSYWCPLGFSVGSGLIAPAPEPNEKTSYMSRGGFPRPSDMQVAKLLISFLHLIQDELARTDVTLQFTPRKKGSLDTVFIAGDHFVVHAAFAMTDTILKVVQSEARIAGALCPLDDCIVYQLEGIRPCLSPWIIRRLSSL